MSAPKGWPSQQKDERLTGQFATVEPIRRLQYGLSVLAHIFAFNSGSDAVEANSTSTLIRATAHAAVKGDIIRFTSGVHSGREVKVHSIPTANSIELAEDLGSAPATLVTFDILKHRYPVVDASGSLSVTAAASPIQFRKNGAAQEVVEDTVTPANNVPLPVKLTGVTGDLTITAQNLNVQSTHTGANPDSMQVGDGTETLSITAAGQAEVAVTAALPAGTNNIGDVDVLTEPATAADAAAALPAVSKVVAGFDGANVRTLHVDAAGDAQVDLASSLPAGTNNIGDVDVLTEPATAIDAAAALPAVSKVIAGFDGANVRTIHTDAAGDVQVDIASALPAGNNNIGDVDIASALPAGNNNIGDVDIASALPAGNNNIGDVDVASLPSIPAGNNNIGDVDVVSLPSIPAGNNNIGDVDVVSLPNVTLNRLSVVDMIDTTPLLDGALILDSGSALKVLVAALAADVKEIQPLSTIGRFVGIYTGAPAAEVLVAIFGPGCDYKIPLAIPATTRVTARSMETTGGAAGDFLAINFLG